MTYQPPHPPWDTDQPQDCDEILAAYRSQQEEAAQLAVTSAIEIFSQVRRQMEQMALAAVPLIRQVARAFAQIQAPEGWVLAPPTSDLKPRRTGRSAQHSTYGPGRRR